MFPLRKLPELSPRTRLRKITRILQAAEIELLHGRGFPNDYLMGLLSLLEKDSEFTGGPDGSSDGKISGVTGCRAPGLAGSLSRLSTALSSLASPGEILRGINTLRNDILASLGSEPSEWDLIASGTGALDRSTVHTRPISAYLEDIRSPFNVGSLLRTAEAFGMERIYLSPRTPLPTHPRARKTARGADEVMPWEVREISILQGRPFIFALELGGTPISAFPFPEQGVALIGSEELGLSPEALGLAERSLGRVTIPLAGAKRSLNVSVAFGILMSWWHAALLSREGPR
jgi:TrmH family RNA methyltransferase